MANKDKPAESTQQNNIDSDALVSSAANLDDVRLVNEQAQARAASSSGVAQFGQVQIGGVDIRHDVQRGAAAGVAADGVEEAPVEAPTAARRLALWEEQNAVRHENAQVNGQEQFRFFIDAGGGEKIYFLDVTGDAEAAIKSLEQYRAKKTTDIEAAYNVQFGRDGQKSIGYDYPSEQYIDIDVRSPFIGELLAIEAGLKSSDPSSFNKDGSKLHIDIPLNPLNQKAGYYLRPDVLGDPRPSSIVLESRYSVWGFDDYKQLVEHELAHNGQENYFSTNAQRLDYGKNLGFVSTSEGWAIETKDGKLYRPTSDHPYPSWGLVNSKGEFLDSNGNLVSADKAEQLRNSQMPARMRIRPSSDYFPNPWEMGAEGATNFRHSESSRADMLTKNPDLYDAMKELDQAEIDRYHGTNADGEPSRIRLPDGSLADNTAANRQTVETFENKFRPAFQPKDTSVPASVFRRHGVTEIKRYNR